MDKRSGNEIFGKEYRARFVTFVGVDLHKSSVTLAAVDRDGGIVSRLTCSTKCVDKLANWIDALPKPVWLAVEAVGFVEWFIDRFRNEVERLDIADAAQLKSLRSKRRPVPGFANSRRYAAG